MGCFGGCGNNSCLLWILLLMCGCGNNGCCCHDDRDGVMGEHTNGCGLNCCGLNSDCLVWLLALQSLCGCNNGCKR